MAEGFYSGATRASLTWLRGANRLDLSGSLASTAYGTDVDGDDTDVRLAASFRRRLSSRFMVDGGVSGWQFRRESLPLYDMDRVGGSLRLGWVASDNWILATSANYNRSLYPSRATAGDGRGETHAMLDVGLAATRQIGKTMLTAEGLFRRNESNAEAAGYRGPVLSLRSQSPLFARMSLSAYAVFGRRSYDTFQYFQVNGKSIELVSVLREDETLQFGFTLGRPINSRMRLFADGSWIRQSSSNPVFGFNQSRFSIGFSLDLVEPPSVRSGPHLLVDSPMRPADAGSGIRFRFRAPEAAEVSLVGGFNAWADGRHPLSGPNKDGVWETVIPLEPGIYRYAFIVDGNWVTPQDAPRYESDGYGGENGVITIGSPGTYQ